MKKTEYSREELIDLCQRAVVHHEKWNDRDSYSSQVGLQSIYKGLTAGFDFTYKIEADTIWITFTNIDKNNLIKGEYLSISSLDDYFEWYKNEYPGCEPEMFNGNGIDWNSNYLGSYMPTLEKINACQGEDWY